MKVSDKQMKRMAESILAGLKDQHVITFKEKEEVVLARATEIIRTDYQREAELDKEVHRMLDELEAQNSAEFQRYKMFPMLKRRLAKEKGFPL